MAPSTRFVVHLRLGGVLVAAERAARPSLRGLPLAVGARPGSQGLVLAVSPEARTAGVEPGMPAGRAAGLAPGVVFLEGRLDRHLDFAAELDATVRRHAGAARWMGLDEAVLEVGGASRLRGLVESLRADLAALGLDVACGIAASPFAAMVSSWLVAPNGVLQVLPGYERQFLSPVAIDALEGLAPEVVARARVRGWSRLGDLAALDEGTAVEAFGGRGLVWQRWCAGAPPAPLGALPALGPAHPVRLVERLAPAPLAPWPSDHASLERVAGDALARLFARADAAGWSVASVALRVERADGRCDARRLAVASREPRAGAAQLAVALVRGLVPDSASQVVVSAAGLRPRAAERAAARPRSRRVALLGKLGAA